MAEPTSSPKTRPQRACPQCGKPSQEASYPFCSKRCADVDLNRWLSGSYSVPVVELEPEDLAELEARQQELEQKGGRGRE